MKNKGLRQEVSDWMESFQGLAEEKGSRRNLIRDGIDFKSLETTHSHYSTHGEI